MSDANHAPRSARPAPRPTLPFDGFGPEEFELLATLEEPASEAVPGGRRMPLPEWGRRLWPRAAWLGLAVILSLGSAGVVAAMSPPGPENRQELTYGADHELEVRLAAAATDLAELNGQVTVLGEQARRLLASLSSIDRAGLEAAYTSGDAALGEIDRLSAALGDRMNCEPWPADRSGELERIYGGTLVAEWYGLCLSLDSVLPLRADWTAMVDGSGVAMGVADGIAEHDRLAEQALQQATQGRYAQALASLDAAAGALDGTRQLADRLSKVGRDVSTLDLWLERIDAMDAALRTLWREMIASEGRITAQVTAALKAVSEAQALLPGSDAVMSVVLYELAGDLLNQGISIEQAKGRLGAALAPLTEAPAD
jgi:hypothetical protein